VTGDALYTKLSYNTERDLKPVILVAQVTNIITVHPALGVNTLLGTNFGFASRPPANPSLIDHLGPWPWYLLSMQAIAVTLFLLLALPLCRRGTNIG